MTPRPTLFAAFCHILRLISARLLLCWHCFCVLCFALCLLFTVTWPVWLVLIVAWCAYWAQVQHG